MTSSLRRLFLVALTLALGTSAFETQAETLDQSTKSSEKTAPCETALLQAQHLNSLELLRSAASCLESKRYLDATFILALGQIRGATDISLFPPATYQGARLVYGLTTRVTYNPRSAGGFGHSEVYRDPAMRAELFRRLENWNPSYSEAYDPGWQKHDSDQAARYDAVLGKQKAYRLALLRNHVTLINNTDYYAAKRELTALNKRTKGRLSGGSEDYKRWSGLKIKLARLKRQLVTPVPKPEIQQAKPQPAEDDPNFRQVYSGWNGPRHKNIILLENERDVARSWLAKALREGELSEVLSKVDFSSQALVAFGIGKRATATGSIYFSKTPKDAPVAYLIMRLGVNEQACDVAQAASYPFAVAVVERSAMTRGAITSSLESSFKDGCKPPKSGQPVE